jgi:hypothetical protein
MPIDPFEDDEEREREEHIEELKQRAQELAGGQMTEGEVNPSSPQVRGQFWEHVVAWEEAPWITNFQQLERKGVALPAPETLDDDQVSMKLWEVIDHLARLRVFLNETDHLSDRELYTLLWSDILKEETKDIKVDEDSAWHIDLVSSGSDADNHLYLKYYADEETREQWRKDYPEDQIPDHEDPPYDRDQYLPQVTYGPPPEAELDESD